MASEGIKEINVISQDTTSYGDDLYGKQQLHVLLEKLSKIKELRLKKVMLTQQEIVLKKHKNLVGNTIPVMIDEKTESNDGWLGRTYGDAPDVDIKVFIQGNHVKAGDIKNMRITGTVGYDLIGTSIHQTRHKGS